MPVTPQEARDIESLRGMMGDTLDATTALNILRKNKGNVEKAALELLEGEDTTYADMPRLEPLDAPVIGPGPRTPPPSKPEDPVIDLTKDDDDQLVRALRASLMDQENGLRPSNRAPDPNWAMVPSNTPLVIPPTHTSDFEQVETTAPSGMSQDDQAMSRAIEASLSYSITEDTYHELPIHERVRVGDTPVALRPTMSSLVYAALIMHGLFFVPQFRHALAGWLPLAEPDDNGFALPTSGPALQAYTALEILCNMDLARLSELNVDSSLNVFTVEQWSTPAERPGDVSTRFYERLAYAVETVLQYNNLFNPERQPFRLMGFTYGNHDAEPDDPNTERLYCVKVNIGANPELNDLISSLAAELAPPEIPRLKAVTKRQAIFEPSQIIAFHLSRDNHLPTYDASVGRKTERATFNYPTTVYLDQFMRDSYDLANQKRTDQRKMLAEVKELEERKKNLLYFNDKDTLADLQSALYYYENVVESNDDPKRMAEIDGAKEKLAGIIEKVKMEAKDIDATMERKRTEAKGLLDCPELQKHRYDLRVVLVHDGLYGRSHLYSYVKQKGKWWKTVDYLVSEVTEESVLNDASGLHLGAGPYFLIYSRALSEAEEAAKTEWPENIKDNVKYNNQQFFSQIPPEIAARFADPNSPPSSPFMVPTPSEHTISSDTVEPPESRDEFMDVD